MISVKSKIFSYLCVLALVIPMTVQSGHIIDHEFQTCEHLDVSHIDTHDFDCQYYHAKILEHGLFHGSTYNLTDSHEFFYRPAGNDFLPSETRIYKRSTRGPPVGLINS